VSAAILDRINDYGTVLKSYPILNFLEQNNGILSKRARENEFKLLRDGEIFTIQKEFVRIFEKD
jgi:hypothetical protein